jgi:hypothetical protein
MYHRVLFLNRRLLFAVSITVLASALAVRCRATEIYNQSMPYSSSSYYQGLYGSYMYGDRSYSNVLNAPQWVLKVKESYVPAGYANATTAGRLTIYGFHGNGSPWSDDFWRRDYLLFDNGMSASGTATYYTDVTKFVQTTTNTPGQSVISGAVGIALDPISAQGLISVIIESRDGSEPLPFLPNVPQAPGDNGVTFQNLPRARYYDPPAASGFRYQMTSNSLFTHAGDFPTGFDHDFTVSVNGIPIGVFAPGQFVDFTTFPGGGVSEFTVSGIQPLVDSADPLAFPLWLDFNTELASFTMTPVPEPSTIFMTAIGALLLAAFARRRATSSHGTIGQLAHAPRFQAVE